MLAYFPLFLFTKTGTSTPTRQKRLRNRIYRVCGATIVVCIVLCGIYLVWFPDTLLFLHPVFWLETLALWAFGFSWFVKGETLWRDPGPHIEQRRLEHGRPDDASRLQHRAME